MDTYSNQANAPKIVQSRLLLSEPPQKQPRSTSILRSPSHHQMLSCNGIPLSLDCFPKAMDAHAAAAGGRNMKLSGLVTMAIALLGKDTASLSQAKSSGESRVAFLNASNYYGYGGQERKVETDEERSLDGCPPPPRKRRRMERRNSKTPAMLMAMNAAIVAAESLREERRHMCSMHEEERDTLVLVVREKLEKLTTKRTARFGGSIQPARPASSTPSQIQKRAAVFPW